MTMTYNSDDAVTLPFGLPLGRHMSEADLPDTEPIALPPDPPQALDLRPVPVKVSETCGPCGSTLALEWTGRQDTLRVLRDWRATHRCDPPPPLGPDAAGNKSALMERAPDWTPGYRDDAAASAGFAALMTGTSSGTS